MSLIEKEGTKNKAMEKGDIVQPDLHRGDLLPSKSPAPKKMNDRTFCRIHGTRVGKPLHWHPSNFLTRFWTEALVIRRGCGWND